MKFLALMMIILSFGLLVPGLSKPVMTLKMSTKIDAQIKKIEIDGHQEEKSILGTVKDLYDEKRLLVASLIFIFSVLIPILKGILLLIALLSKKVELRKSLFKIINGIGKWSMADVFVIAIFLVYLSTNESGMSKSFDFSLFGMSLPIKVNSLIQTQLQSGFYFFLSYCLLSLVSLHIVKIVFDREKI